MSALDCTKCSPLVFFLTSSHVRHLSMKSFGVAALVLANGLGLLQPIHGGYPSQVPRPHPAASFKTILHFSDVHLNISHDEQTLASNDMQFRYGNDATLRLLDSSLQYAKQVLPHPDLFLFTGDNVPHGAKPATFVAQSVDTNIRKLEEYFPASEVLMLEATAILGNGDTSPNYHMEVTDPDSADVNPSIGSVSDAWKNSLSKENFELFNRRGYLQYKLDDKLWLLTLNTVIYSSRHTPDTSTDEDPFGQFAWLRKTLTEVRNHNELVFIAGHIPPMLDWFGGNPQWLEPYIESYKSIAQEFADVIRAQFFGHVHSLEFRIPRGDEKESSLPPLFLSGSISPLFKNNPSFMVWKYDTQTFQIMDYAVYGTDLNEKEQTTDWKFQFEALQAYGVDDLSSESLRGMQQRMDSDPELFQRYYENVFAHSSRVAKCDNANCKAKFMCSLTWWSTKKEFQECVAQRAPNASTNSSNASGNSTVAPSRVPSSTTLPVPEAPKSKNAITPSASANSPATSDVSKPSTASFPVATSSPSIPSSPGASTQAANAPSKVSSTPSFPVSDALPSNAGERC